MTTLNIQIEVGHDGVSSGDEVTTLLADLAYSIRDDVDAALSGWQPEAAGSVIRDHNGTRVGAWHLETS